MLRHLGFVSILTVVLTACAVTDMPQGGVTGGTLETFDHRVATSEVVLLWNCLQPEPGLLRVVGEAQNPWQAQPIQYLEHSMPDVACHGNPVVGVIAGQGFLKPLTGAAQMCTVAPNPAIDAGIPFTQTREAPWQR